MTDQADSRELARHMAMSAAEARRELSRDDVISYFVEAEAEAEAEGHPRESVPARLAPGDRYGEERWR